MVLLIASVALAALRPTDVALIVTPEVKHGRVTALWPKLVNRTGRTLKVYTPEWWAVLQTGALTSVDRPCVIDYLFVSLKPHGTLKGSSLPIGQLSANLRKGDYRIVCRYDDDYVNYVGKSWGRHSQVGRLSSEGFRVRVASDHTVSLLP